VLFVAEMRSTWRRVALFLMAGLGGCWLDHGPEADASSCAAIEPSLEVSLEAVSPSDRCEPGPIDGFVQSIDDADDVLAIAVGTCPPDVVCIDDQVCRIEVRGGGPALGVALAVGDSISGFVAPPTYARLTRDDCCLGFGCECTRELALYARLDNPARTAPEPDGELSFDVGETTCGPIGGTRPMCGLTEFSIDARSGSDSVRVAPRQTLELAATGVRVRNVAAKNDTGEDAGPLAALVAWR
jgi:hypothetical protein